MYKNRLKHKAINNNWTRPFYTKGLYITFTYSLI
jgi:hypothetical protein